MGSKLTCMNEIISVAGYRLNVTVRFDVGLLSVSQGDGEESDVDEQKLLNNIYKLIHVTVSKWLLVARAYEQYQTDKTKPDPVVLGQSAEIDLFTAPIFSEEPLVTVWAHGSEPLTLHSHSNPYSAFILWCAFNAYKVKHEDQRRIPAPNAPPTPTAQPAQPTPVSTSGFELPEGVIWGTSIDSRQVNYTDKQQVAFAVTEIGFEAVGEDNIPAWKLHTPHGKLTVFVNTKSGGETYDYKALKKYFPQIGITMERPHATGSWVVVVKAAHSGGREYLNFKTLYDADGVEQDPLTAMSRAGYVPDGLDDNGNPID